MLPRRHIVVVEGGRPGGLSPLLPQDPDLAPVGEGVGASRDRQRLEDGDVRRQDEPTGRVHPPEHVDVETVDLPDFHGERRVGHEAEIFTSISF